jgi:hypothetical protein
MDGTRDHHVKQSKPGTEAQSSHVFPHMWNLTLKHKCAHKYIDDIYGEREGENMIVIVEGTN